MIKIINFHLVDDSDEVERMICLLKSKYYLKFLFSLTFLLLSHYSWATNYYFSATIGNDSYTAKQAQSSKTPWKSLSKLNSFFVNINPGDSILFKRGEVFAGNIIITKSGTPSMPIVIGAYGTGTNPLISGLTKLSVWESLGGGIYKSSCPVCDISDNLVTLNGIEQALGRYPDTGYLTYQNHNANSSITDSSLNTAINWAGAKVVIRKNRWVIDKINITSQSSGTINYATGTSDVPTSGFGYFIQNDLRTLSKLGEWYFDPNSKNMYVYFGSNNNPDSYIVNTSIVNILVDINGYGYITFNGISFEGANVSTFQISNSQYISIENCNIDLSGTDAVDGHFCPYLTIQNSNINHSLNDAINIDADCSNALISNNIIKNTGLITGMGANGTGTYEAITSFGSNSLIQFNEIDSTGYDVIYFGGNNTVVKNNFINTFCSVKDDGGGIYVGDWTTWVGKQIISNIVINGIGAGQGTDVSQTLMAEGIYIDDGSANTQVLYNTVANCPDIGIKIHDAHDIIVQNNTVYNNLIQLFLDHDAVTASPLRNINIKKNILFSKTQSQLSVNFLTVANDIRNFGAADSNYYSSPISDNFTFHTQVPSDDWLGSKETLPGWQTLVNTDPHSKASPINYSPYTSVMGKQIINLTFATNSLNSDGISKTQGGASTWVSGILDGGTLKVNPSANSTALIYIPVGAVTSGKDYILRFSSLGTNYGSLQAYLLESEAHVDYGASNKNVTIQTSRKENEVVLHSTYSTTNESVVIKVYNSDGICYFDNIQFYAATVTYVNPDNYILFEYNPTNSTKTISLNNSYIDALNNFYKNAVSLKPYSSIVLMVTGYSAGKATINQKQSGQPVIY